MSESVVQLRFPAKPDYLLLARLTLSGITRDLPLGDEVLADLKLALTEACGNVVRHAYTGSDGDVSVAFTIDDNRILMTVQDYGDGIRAPDAIVETPVEGPLEGGMGMSIIRAIVDELEVEPGHDGQGTIVRMVKYLTPPS
jgi:anti-sigma regulatory factor (Ser/Thr protein kinase)